MGARRSRGRSGREEQAGFGTAHARTGAEEAAALPRAFHRMACLFANLVCGIWLVLLTTLWLLDPDRPGAGSLLLVLLVSAPVAYGVPYGAIRLVGMIVARRRRGGAGNMPTPPDSSEP